MMNEHEEQCALMAWCAYNAARLKGVERLFAIPNGGARDVRVARKMKAEGVKRGVPDMFLPVARGGAHGLFIELKRVKGGRVSEEQKDWIETLTREGYRAAVCHGWQEASQVIEDYMKE